MIRCRLPSYEYKSIFSNELHSFLKFRKSLGYACRQEPYVFKTLDDHFCGMRLMEKEITYDLFESWIESLPIGPSTKSAYTSRYRTFALYLQKLGCIAYVPQGFTMKSHYVPQIFSDNELKRLFKACDNLKTRRSATNAHISFPVVVRMLYGCGLRISEALGLKIADVDLRNGILHVRNAKGNRDRLVPMSKSLTGICRQYFKAFHSDAAPEDYFFHSENGTCYLNCWASKWMYVVLEQAGLDRNVNPENGKGRALHALRHTFAVNSLRKMQTDDVDRYRAIPILSTYMGHDDIYGTELYLQMTADVHADMIQKVTAYSASVFPEVE